MSEQLAGGSFVYGQAVSQYDDLAQRLADWGAIVAGGAALGGTGLYLLTSLLKMAGFPAADPLESIERGAAIGAFIGLVALVARWVSA